MSQEILINIPRDPNRPTTVSVNGCTGPACKNLTLALEQSLGSVTAVEHTEEFDMIPPVELDQQQQNSA